jgi:hypothetical protein
MKDIIKTWPAFMDRGRVLKAFTSFENYYFTIGRGLPRDAIGKLWYTHRGQIIGHFAVKEIVQNAGQLPQLTSISGEESAWQIKPDSWVAICPGPFEKLIGERVYYPAFRGFRYFDLEEYRGTMESKVRV